MGKCPICERILQRETVVKYKDHGGCKVVGNYVFCPNRQCNFQK